MTKERPTLNEATDTLYVLATNSDIKKQEYYYERCFDRLIEELDNKEKEIEELQYDFDILRNRAIETAFSQYNDDVELLLRYLSKKGYVKKDKEYYYNPLGDDPNYLKKKENKFISKDKIRDKIKELEEDREKVRNIYEPSDDDGEFIQTYQILVLKELLEEE